MNSRISWEVVLIGLFIVFFAVYLMSAGSDTTPETPPDTTANTGYTENESSLENMLRDSDNDSSDTPENTDESEIESVIEVEDEVEIQKPPATRETLSALGNSGDGKTPVIDLMSGAFAERYHKKGTMIHEEVFSPFALAEIRADVSFGYVRLVAHEENDIRVRLLLPEGVSSEEFENIYDWSSQKTPESIRLRLSRKDEESKGFLSWLFNLGKTSTTPFAPGVEILVPEGGLTYILNLSAGSIEVSGVGGDVNATTKAGNIDIDRAYGLVKAETSAGNVRVSGLNGVTELRSRAGNISITDSDAHVNARTSAGNIDFVQKESLRSAELETRLGNIAVHLSPQRAYNLEMSGTEVKLDPAFTFTGERSNRRMTGTLNQGGPEIKVSTRLGSIEIKSL